MRLYGVNFEFDSSGTGQDVSMCVLWVSGRTDGGWVGVLVASSVTCSLSIQSSIVGYLDQHTIRVL